MVRIQQRGGTWSNVEDEVLKAAVMKYGHNQWARVASLMNRKSPKQCKARWYEWLDPSIKKTEFTRDEDEKLLHLAKLYPCQWRTIAPLVGRTAAQCMERYERLLDDAQRELAADGDAPAMSSEEARRLRPGEIDVLPETRPARPDPVDMAPEELEMLSEARARLANTRGKKAKRKAREAQLDEARRLASLQKRRELKAAGIHVARFSGSRRSRGGSTLDYDAEVPFQKVAPRGFYDTSEEKRADADLKRAREDADFEAIRLERLEAERRDTAEARAARDDKRKRAKLMETNLPEAVAQVSRLTDPAAKLRRSELALPAPQVSDAELAELGRLGGADAATGDATDDLVDRAGVDRLLSESRSARTPAVARADDLVVQEAKNAAVDRSLQTPLLGEDQAPRLDGTGYAAAAPRKPGGAPTETPLSSALRKTPNALGLNDDDAASAFSGAASERRPTRLDVRRGLESLPAPKYAYDIEQPANPPEEEPPQPAIVVDAAELDAARQAAAEAETRARLARRSSAVRAQLPRPRLVSDDLRPLGESEAALLVRDEMAKLLRRDAVDHPVKGAPRAIDENFDDDDDDDDFFGDEELDRARDLVIREAGLLEIDDDAFESQWRATFEDTVFFPNGLGWGKISDGPADIAFRADFDASRAQMTKGATRAARIEERLEPKLDSYVARAKQLRDDISRVTSRLDKAALEAACYDRLRRVELLALPNRLAAAKARLAQATRREKHLQTEYSALRRKRGDQ